MDTPPVPPTQPPSPPSPPSAVPQRPRGWWSRNWKWFVPTGCFTLLLLFVGFVLSICFLVFSILKSSDVYKDAVKRAKAEPAVIEAIGQPMKEGLFPFGNTNVNGPKGEANLSISISGPKGHGTIYVEATKSAGHWNYSVLAVQIDHSEERIDLLHELD